jgi:hypothetical protein
MRAASTLLAFFSALTHSPARHISLVGLLLVSQSVLGQEPVVIPPVDPIAVVATEHVDLGDPIRISVKTSGTGVLVRVRQILPGEDLDVSANLLDLEGTGEFGFTNKSPGGYLIEVQAIVGDRIVSDYAYSRIGSIVPQPPPGPSPEPDPNPPPAPGPKNILVIHETGEISPILSQVFIKLRTGDAQKYLNENKHKLYILDDDLQPGWAQILGSTKLPAIIISDPSRGASGSVVRELPKTADEIMALIKQHD